MTGISMIASEDIIDADLRIYLLKNFATKVQVHNHDL